MCTNDKIPCCSFCGKTNKEVDKLITSPVLPISICNECMECIDKLAKAEVAPIRDTSNDKQCACCYQYVEEVNAIPELTGLFLGGESDNWPGGQPNLCPPVNIMEEPPNLCPDCETAAKTIIQRYIERCPINVDGTIKTFEHAVKSLRYARNPDYDSIASSELMDIRGPKPSPDFDPEKFAALMSAVLSEPPPS